MKYYVRERKFEDYNTKTAGNKARDDVERIAEAMGYQPIDVYPDLGDRTKASAVQKLRKHFDMGRIWKQKLSVLKTGDTLFMQLPPVNNCFYLARILKKLKKKNVRIIAVVHDLELLRMNNDTSIGLKQKLRMTVEEKSTLRICDKLIVHNEKMLRCLADMDIPQQKMIALGIFDYLMDEQTAAAVKQRTAPTDRTAMIVAGNLNREKAGYVYVMPQGIPMNLYGVNYQKNDNPSLSYRGSFLPDELPAKLEGAFGLVWDGESAETCSGAYGEYLRYNNPHKTSLYLASGLPVVIWKQAAMADFVLREQVGIATASIAEAKTMLEKLTETEYQGYADRVKTVGEKLRNGAYLKTAIAAAEKECGT